MQASRSTVGSETTRGFRIVPADSPDVPCAPPLGQHWLALHAVVADGFAVIELLHDDGRRAEWFFDGAGRQSNSISAWSAETLEALRTAFRPAMAALRDALLPTFPLRLDPANTTALHDFMNLGARLRDTIATVLQGELLSNPLHHDIDAVGYSPLPWLSPTLLRQALSVNLQERLVIAMRDGELTWPSPVNSAEMPCTGSFTLDDFNYLFRFFDRASGLDMFVVATEHVSRVAGLYVPGQGVVASLGGDQARMLRQHAGSLGNYVLRHMAQFADSLLAGNAQPATARRFAAFFRPGASAHLGHQLWNELTGIDALVTTLPQDRLPLLLIAGLPGHEIEFYGPVDVLFPETAGRVLRGFVNHSALVRYAYEQRLLLCRLTRERVGDGLRRRVMARAADHSAAIWATGRIFVIGLRVENRTAVNLDVLCALMIEEAVRLHPGCTIVFDGHNARGDVRSDDTISSHRESAASEQPLAMERRVVKEMRERFANHDVCLVDTLGEPLSVSLAWSAACDGFLALWGAGLAKYRWVANKPGLIVTSRWNLENKGDLRLYDDGAYMEAPTPALFVPAEVMQDLPSAPMLVPFEHPSYSNFTFAPDAMRFHIREFLAALNGPPGALETLAMQSAQRSSAVTTLGIAV